MSNFKNVKITDLKPSTYNPRVINKEDYKKLTDSINEYGLVDPIIVNLQNMTIIGGHQRYDVLLDKYNKNEIDGELILYPRGDIGWVFIDGDLTVKSDNHEKGLNIALNRISGEWDIPRLENLLTELSYDDFDIHLTGFDSLNLKDELPELQLDDEDDDFFTEMNTGRIELIITFDNEEDQETLYEELSERGYKCKMKC